jgi:hypothetical protein
VPAGGPKRKCTWRRLFRSVHADRGLILLTDSAFKETNLHRKAALIEPDQLSDSVWFACAATDVTAAGARPGGEAQGSENDQTPALQGQMKNCSSWDWARQ